jgi:glycine/D-amino acid oxidase-like deaminating enzyme
VIYACGHSRNGILLAPLTGQVVADLVTGATPRYDLSRFLPGRHYELS